MNNDTTVNVRIVGQNETQAAVDEAKSGFAGLWKQVAGGQIAFQLVQDAWQGVKSSFSAVKQANDAWQQQTAALNAALKSTNDVSGVTKDQAISYAEALQKQTPITKDAALAGENMLLTFTNLHSNVFPQATQAVADVATAMNHGMTPNAQMLTQTAVQLGIALNDPATGMTRLRRIGVTFDAQQQAQIKTLTKSGDTLGAQKIILAELGKEFGGRATANAQTFQGRITMLKNTMIDWGVNALQWISRELNHLWVVAQPVFAFLDKMFRPAFEQLGNTIKNDLMPVIEQHKKGLEDILKVFGFVVAIIIGAVIAAFYALIKVITFVVAAFADIIRWGSAVVKFFTNDLPNAIIGAVKDAGKWLYDAGKNIIQGLLDGIKAMIDKPVKEVKNMGKDVVKAFKDVLGIHSPSKVFAEIGQNMGAGLIQGLQDVQPQANLNVTQLVTGSQLVNSSGSVGRVPASSTTNNTSNMYGGNTQHVNIQQVVLGSNEAVQQFFKQINQDNINVSRGLTPVQGAY